MRIGVTRRKRLDLLWSWWDVGLLDDAWPPEEASAENL